MMNLQKLKEFIKREIKDSENTTGFRTEVVQSYHDGKENALEDVLHFIEKLENEPNNG